VRRLGGAVALAALLMALPAPALAAPEEGSAAFSGVLVLDWIQGVLVRLGFVVSVPDPSDEPTNVHQRARDVMDPDGVASYGDTNLTETPQTLVERQGTDD